MTLEFDFVKASESDLETHKKKSHKNRRYKSENGLVRWESYWFEMIQNPPKPVLIDYNGTTYKLSDVRQETEEDDA